MRERLGTLQGRLLALALGVLLLATYICLPDQEALVDTAPAEAAQSAPGAAGNQPPADKLEIFDVRPQDPTPGGAVVIRYSDSKLTGALGASLGRVPLEVIEHSPGQMVVRLPGAAELGHQKLRIQKGDQRSKPYDVAIRGIDWRKRFRNLVGGLALVLFSLEFLGRAVREATGLEQATRLRSLTGHRGASLAFGGVLGALMPSAPSVAGLLGALVSSNVLAVSAAAVVFMGAQLGAAAAPWALASFVTPGEGLLAVAAGAVWLRWASDRRSKAIARAIFGAGLMLFGLHVLRPGFEPLLSEPTLLSWFGALRGPGLAPLLGRVALGAALAFVLQGPTPVLLLVVSLAETTGFFDFPGALSVVGGAGLGAALGGALAIPRRAHGRGFGLLTVGLGAFATLVTTLGLPLWCGASDFFLQSLPHEVRWGERVLLPNLGQHLALAFWLSQLAAAAVALPVVPRLGKWVEKRLTERRTIEPGAPGLRTSELRVVIAESLAVQSHCLAFVNELSRTGSLTLSGRAERDLGGSRVVLEQTLTKLVTSPAVLARSSMQAALLSCLQLNSSLELMLRQTERLVAARLAATSPETGVPALPEPEATALSAMHSLLSAGFDDVIQSLRRAETVDLEQARSREIQLNMAEAQLRESLANVRTADNVRLELSILEVAAAVESAGNHVYRLGQLFSEPLALAEERASDGALSRLAV